MTDIIIRMNGRKKMLPWKSLWNVEERKLVMKGILKASLFIIIDKAWPEKLIGWHRLCHWCFLILILIFTYEARPSITLVSGRYRDGEEEEEDCGGAQQPGGSHLADWEDWEPLGATAALTVNILLVASNRPRPPPPSTTCTGNL